MKPWIEELEMAKKAKHIIGNGENYETRNWKEQKMLINSVMINPILTPKGKGE